MNSKIFSIVKVLQLDINGTNFQGQEGSTSSYLMVRNSVLPRAWSSLAFLILAGSPKHLQNLKVSSAAAEHTDVPSGLCERCNTLEVWPLNSPTLTMLGYFHRQSWFCENPWLLKISFSWVLHWSAHTCKPLMFQDRQFLMIISQAWELLTSRYVTTNVFNSPTYKSILMQQNTQVLQKQHLQNSPRQSHERAIWCTSILSLAAAQTSDSFS